MPPTSTTPVTFLYIADTHLGATPDETLRPDLLPLVMEQLAAWLRERSDISFVLHGGDMVAEPDAYLIRQAAALFRLPVPVYLCVGPSDLPNAEAEQTWLREAPAFFPGRRVDFAVETPVFTLHAVPPDNRNLPALLAERDGRSRIVCTHQTVLGRPAPPPLTGTLADRLLTNGSIRAVLASANHLASVVERQGVPFLAVQSLVAPPYSFLEISVGAAGAAFAVHSLAAKLPEEPPPSMDMSYFTGRAFPPHPPWSSKT